MINTVIGLTEQQYRVLSELCEDGAGNAEIGRRLFISQDTVKSHIKDLLQRTGTCNRTELAVKVVTRRILVGLQTRAGERRDALSA